MNPKFIFLYYIKLNINYNLLNMENNNNNNTEYDIIIIGGGLAGLTSAFYTL